MVYRRSSDPRSPQRRGASDEECCQFSSVAPPVRTHHLLTQERPYACAHPRWPCRLRV